MTLTNEAGSSRSASSLVYVSDTEVVRGKLCNGADNSGWCWQRPLPQGNVVLDYFYLNDLQGWAVGEAGTVLATSDGGVTWQAQHSGVELSLTKVMFANTQIGWIASTNGQLLKTVDGGAHWKLVSFGQSDTVQAIGASDANTAWVVGSYSSLYITTNGGASWSKVSPPQIGAQKMVPLTGSDIWALTYGYPTELAHSTDGGANWSGVALPAVESGLYRSLYDLQFIDASHGWAIGSESGWVASTQTYVSRQVLLSAPKPAASRQAPRGGQGNLGAARRFLERTADGGSTWQRFSVNLGYANNFKFVDASHGFAWSWYANEVLRTSDGGASWQALPLPAGVYNYIALFRPFSAQSQLIQDAAGHVYLSHDSAATWIERPASGSTAAWLNSVWFFDSREGIALGADGSATRTTDGGQTWVTTASQSSYGWRRLQFVPDGSIGWAISDTGAVYRSSDKGQSWLSPVVQTSASLYGVTDFHFIDDQHGWAVMPYAWSGQASIYRSVDGGTSWQAVAGTTGYGSLVSLRFADATHGVAVGAAGVAMVTSDAGLSWAPRATGIDRALRRVTFIDVQTALAVGDGGAIVRSVDQGETWTRIDSGSTYGLNDVRFISSKLGWAVGEFGTVLATRDGGLTWTAQASGMRSNLLGAFFVDEQTGWIVGENGKILATATGGR